MPQDKRSTQVDRAVGPMLTKKQMQRKGLSRRQAVELHKLDQATPEGVRKEIEANGKWRDKIVLSDYARRNMARAVKL